jgi:hypothetical protein
MVFPHLDAGEAEFRHEAHAMFERVIFEGDGATPHLSVDLPARGNVLRESILRKFSIVDR